MEKRGEEQEQSGSNSLVVTKLTVLSVWRWDNTFTEPCLGWLLVFCVLHHSASTQEQNQSSSIKFFIFIFVTPFPVHPRKESAHSEDSFYPMQDIWKLKKMIIWYWPKQHCWCAAAESSAMLREMLCLPDAHGISTQHSAVWTYALSCHVSVLCLAACCWHTLHFLLCWRLWAEGLTWKPSSFSTL